MLSQINKILDDISVQISEDHEHLSESVKKLLAVMEYDIPYTGKALMEKLGAAIQRRIPQKLSASGRRYESDPYDDF